MNFDEIIKNRYSCRDYEDEIIKDDELNQILEASRLAPTAVNFQPQRIYVVKDEKLLEGLKKATRYTFNSKTVLVVCYDKSVSWKRKYDNKDHGDIDSSIVATYMMLKAFDLGIGSCYVCAYDEKIVKEVLNLDDNLVVSCMLPLGYPKVVGKQNSRKDLNDTIIIK